MKVLMIGQNTGNFGDEAAGLGCIDVFTSSESIDKFGVMYRARKTENFNKLPTDNAKVFHEGCFGYTNRIVVIILCIIHYILPFLKNISLFKEVRRFVGKMKKYDYILVGPMGVDIGKYKNWYLLFQLLLAKQHRYPVCFHLVSVESSGNIIFDRIANSVLRKAGLFVREHRSQNYLKTLGLKSVFGIDTAFAMKSSLVAADNAARKQDYIVLILSEKLIGWHPDFKDKDIDSHKLIMESIVLPAVDYAKRSGLSVRLINHTTDKKEKANLKRIVNEASKNFNDITFRNVKMAYEYENEIKDSLFVITMRYHGVVISVKNHIPFIALSYENKMNEVSSYSGCAKNCINLSELIDGTGYVSKMIGTVVENYDKIKLTLNKFDNSPLIRTVFSPLRSIEKNGFKNF